MTPAGTLDTDEAVLSTAQWNVSEHEEGAVTLMFLIKRLDALTDTLAHCFLAPDCKGDAVHERVNDPVNEFGLLRRHRIAESVTDLQLAVECPLRFVLAKLIILCFHITLIFNNKKCSTTRC